MYVCHMVWCLWPITICLRYPPYLIFLLRPIIAHSLLFRLCLCGRSRYSIYIVFVTLYFITLHHIVLQQQKPFLLLLS